MPYTVKEYVEERPVYGIIGTEVYAAGEELLDGVAEGGYAIRGVEYNEFSDARKSGMYGAYYQPGEKIGAGRTFPSYGYGGYGGYGFGGVLRRQAEEAEATVG